MRYFFILQDDDCNDLTGLKDGNSKKSAVAEAKSWMKEHGLKKATLQVSSVKTEEIVAWIDITI